jgi:carboxylesterase type B
MLIAAITGLTACGEIPPDDPSRVGDGIGSTADERNALNYDPVHGCTFGTELILNPEPGAPYHQALCGVIESDANNEPLYVYQGIQYAASTAGNNRWTDPKPPQWDQLRAVEYGPSCPQGFSDNMAAAGVSEDCLYLNIWTPKITLDNSGNLPVMVFIHGGAFIFGSGGSAIGQQPGRLNTYDGTEFVSTARADGGPVVFVTLNYRLGALGLMAGDDLGLDGNYAIKDQTAALEWVQRNISLFGGDPDNVTIFGESAGAQSVALHLTIRDQDHQSLFDRAIMESNYAIAYMDLENAQRKANDLAWWLGCSESSQTWPERLACLRQAELADILDAQLLGAYDARTIACQGLQAIIPWNPVLDGRFITHDPIDSQITKPVILGTNLNESIPFIASWLPSNPTAQTAAYVGLIEFLFGPIRGTTILGAYQLQYPNASVQERFEQVVTDYLWTCFNRALAEVPSADTRRYHYVHHGSYSYWVDAEGNVSGRIPEACTEDDAVCHADELPFVFGNPANDKLFEKSFTTDEADMSLALRRYWIAFARTANPNVHGQTEWPLNDSGWLGRVLQIQAPSSAIEAVTGTSIAGPANCDLIWDPVGYKVRSSYDCNASDLAD